MKYKFAPAFISNFFTPLYDLILEQGGLGKSLQERIIKALDIIDGETILDVGCGTGGLLVMLKKKYSNSKIVGTDPDEKILELAREKVSKNDVDVQLLNAWSEKQPFKDGLFDIVISSLTFHHLPTEIKREALREVKRILKSDERFLLVDIGKPDNLIWKIKFLLDPERLFSTKEYMRDNLEGKIPNILLDEGFSFNEILPRYQGVQFFLARKESSNASHHGVESN